MRMRYERRDPRPEDLRQIDELKSLTDSQEKDIFYLTEQLRELQMQHQQLQQQFASLQQNSNSSSPTITQQNQNQQSKKGKSKNIKNSNNSNNSNNVRGHQQPSQVEGSKNVNNPQMNSHMPPSTNSQIQINVNNENEHQQQHQPTRVKPPPLIKTVIYEEENENELYEEQLREEREIAERLQQQQQIEELQSCVMVELMPESPDYSTKQSNEEISEAQIITDAEILKNVPILAAPLPSDKGHEFRVEVISTIEPSNIQVVPRGSEMEF